MNRLFFLCSVLVFLPPAGCGQPENRWEELPSLTFSTTDSLVAERIVDSLLAISFRPPSGWMQLPRKSIDSALKRVNQNVTAPSEQTPTLRTAFTEKSSGSYFVAAKLDSFSIADTAVFVQRAIEYYRAIDSSTVVRSALFRWGPFRIQQLMVITSQTVTIKMIFSQSEVRRQPFEWDFQIPKALYPDKARTVESVVGSLQIHNSIH